jgi:DNA-directed RNA polymerase subunit RPC12/RpoP
VQFEQQAQEELISDAEVIAQVKAGPDIHCAYCGTRNPATATQCSQCLADLSEGAARQKGETLGAHRDKPAPEVACPHCGVMNAANAARCTSCDGSLAKPKPPSEPTAPPKKTPVWLFAVGGIALLLLCCCLAVFAFMSVRTEEVVGRVESTQWQTVVLIEELRDVERSDWRDQVPGDGRILSCSESVRNTSETYQANSVEVCGEPYTVDTGSGVGEVVQDCYYEVYDDYCSYEVEEWQVVDSIIQNGDDTRPVWAEPSLAAGQRQGQSDVTFVVVFRTDGKTYEYNPDTLEEYARFRLDDSWVLNVNGFDTVVSVEEAP